MALFRNFYRCDRCGHEWTDDWSATCDDDCPQCGARHMSPFKSEATEAEVVRKVFRGPFGAMVEILRRRFVGRGSLRQP
jgi:DNA-directed RNA polymerase subunit RPC12/RpoP